MNIETNPSMNTDTETNLSMNTETNPSMNHEKAYRTYYNKTLYKRVRARLVCGRAVRQVGPTQEHNIQYGIIIKLYLHPFSLNCLKSLLSLWTPFKGSTILLTNCEK